MKVLREVIVLFSILALSFGSEEIGKDDGRIVGGVQITIKQAPYQVALLYDGRQGCGGKKKILPSTDFKLTF
jgi:hypothetical protein